MRLRGEIRQSHVVGDDARIEIELAAEGGLTPELINLMAKLSTVVEEWTEERRSRQPF